jgi:hypothetical protein
VVRTALRSSHREFDAESLVRAMVFNRLCAPDSSLPKFRSSRLILTSLRVAPRRKINDLDS